MPFENLRLNTSELLTGTLPFQPGICSQFIQPGSLNNIDNDNNITKIIGFFVFGVVFQDAINSLYIERSLRVRTR